MNMATVRAFAAEDREAAEHKTRVAGQRMLSIRSWDYANLRIDTLVAPMAVLTNALGLLLAVSLGGGRLGAEAIVVTFAYYSNATRIMFEFNQIYRRLESSLTEAAQFTELLLTPPTVLDPVSPEPLRPTSAGVRFKEVTFAHAGAPPLFTGLDLTVPSGTKIGLVGRSGGGKTTLIRLLLRLMDIDEGRILVGRSGHLTAAPGRPAQSDRLRATGPSHVSPDAARQHRVRKARCQRRRDIPCRPSGTRHRVRRDPARRVGHDGRGTRNQAVRRPAPAGRDRPGHPA